MPVSNAIGAGRRRFSAYGTAHALTTGMMKNSIRTFTLLAASLALFGFEGSCGEPEPEVCPAIACLADCPFGSRTDLNGCDTCECLPPPRQACESLGEAACNARQDCDAVYQEDVCVCPLCAPGANCPPCECDPIPAEFVRCETGDVCVGLDENACIADSRCEPWFTEETCVAPGSGGGIDGFRAPPQCDPITQYGGCVEAPVCSEVLCTLYCENGFARGEDGCFVCSCL